ncbi:hypothetical protein [Pseudanabaena minima]|uniref:hypothetical protein n=1 Tax=Pseudanabaena minima TaxID=890415 RepID=UPI003DA9012A
MDTTMIGIGVQGAVEAASKYFHELQRVIKSTLLEDNTTQIRDLRLEEVELSDDRSQWLITLGYSISEDGMGIRSVRHYKIFTVDATTGEVQSMKIREV